MSGAAPYLYPGCGHTQALKRRKRQEHPEACGDCVHGRRTPPSVWQAAVCADAGGVLPLLNGNGHAQGHWAAGWLHWLTGRALRPHPDALASTATVLTGWLERALREDQPATTAQVTRCLTRELWAAADATPDAKSWRELRLPVMTPGTTHYGRLDVTIWQPRFPDIVVEIDSKAKRGSVQKLEFARDAGALPIWVRHGSGPIDVPERIAVIDLRKHAIIA